MFGVSEIIGAGDETVCDVDEREGGFLPEAGESDKWADGLLRSEEIPSRPPCAWTLVSALSRSDALMSTSARSLDRELESCRTAMAAEVAFAAEPAGEGLLGSFDGPVPER